MGCSPLPCWVYVIFRFFGRPGPLLAQFGLDFGGFGPPFWRFLGSILEVSGHDLGPMWLVILILLSSIFSKLFKLNSGWGWAGGVTRSAKNFKHISPSFGEGFRCRLSQRALTSEVDFATLPQFKDFVA